ncbi:hypothetical protein JOM56_013479 [Amanita muscaria]
MPNGQVCRSAWKELEYRNPRIARNVQFRNNDIMQYAEVLYFFPQRVGQQERPLAMISLYSVPDMALKEQSSGTLLVCWPLGRESITVIDATSIELVVGMVPFPSKTSEDYADSFYVVEKPSIGTWQGSEGSEDVTTGSEGDREQSEDGEESEDDSDDSDE